MPIHELAKAMVRFIMRFFVSGTASRNILNNGSYTESVTGSNLCKSPRRLEAEFRCGAKKRYQ